MHLPDSYADEFSKCQRTEFNRLAENHHFWIEPLSAYAAGIVTWHMLGLPNPKFSLSYFSSPTPCCPTGNLNDTCLDQRTQVQTAFAHHITSEGCEFDPYGGLQLCDVEMWFAPGFSDPNKCQ